VGVEWSYTCLFVRGMLLYVVIRKGGDDGAKKKDV